MEKSHSIFSDRQSLRKILSMLLIIAMVVLSLPATAYAYDSTVENCTNTITIRDVSENATPDEEGTGVSSPKIGILVVAHGSPEDSWNQPVRDAVESIDCPYPVELGFLEYVAGEDIGTAVANLEKQGVEHIITVPIFVASASDHIEEIKYMLGIPNSITEKEAIETGLEVIPHNAEIEMTLALDDHQLVAEILDDRIATVSQQPDQEIVILAAHGTSAAADLAVWKNNLASLGQQLKENGKFLDVDYGFVAIGEPKIRAVVEAQQEENPRASIIVMPVMLSEGAFTGTEIPEALSGLTYIYPAEGQRSLLPHDDISHLIVARAYDAIGVFAGGDGTTESPYQIATAEQLNRVRYHLDKHFILTADIDLSDYNKWEPIGTFQPLSDKPEDAETADLEIAFTGTFDGNGHTISNVNIDQPEGTAVGLFGCTAGKEADSSSIYDLTVENVNVTGATMVGGVVGVQYSNCTLVNVNLTGNNKVRGHNNVGGITGGSLSDMKDCDAIADIVLQLDGGNHAGVLSGGLEGCSVINCTAQGNVTAEEDGSFGLGGLAGCVFDGVEISGCHAEVEITALGENNTMVGGLLGHTGTFDLDNPTLVTNCSADTVITISDSTIRVGGLVGGGFYHEMYKSEMPVPTSYRIKDCNTSGTITGGSKVGSIAGYAYCSTVENCTSTLTWTCHEVEQIGYAESAFAGGSGTESDPYRIAMADQLDKVRYYLDKHFILTDNIDLSGYENWKPIGVFQPLPDKEEDTETADPEMAFTGTFNGNGYTISNLTINQSEGMAVGLFGCTAGEEKNPSSIYDLKVENVDVTGNFLVGGVVGYQALGYILENVSLTGSNTVRGYQGTGGITGGTFGDLISCDAVADIVVLGDGGCWAGVLLGGQGNSVVNNCTATGTITAERDNCWGLGGLAGNAGYDQGAEVTNCHADVSITALGENNTMVGGLLGFAGTFGEDAPAQITGCSANTTIMVSNSTERVGGLVGGSFYHELYAEERPVPSSYAITDCATSGSITGGGNEVGSIAGYAYNSTVENCTSTLTWTCHKVKQIGYSETTFEI